MPAIVPLCGLVVSLVRTLHCETNGGLPGSTTSEKKVCRFTRLEMLEIRVHVQGCIVQICLFSSSVSERVSTETILPEQVCIPHLNV